MADKKFKVGDEVFLNSGSPEMTVRGYENAEYDDSKQVVICDWFDAKHQNQTATFFEEQLTKDEDE